MEGQRVVSREEWLKEREALLEEEKKLSKLRREVAKKRQNLPLVAVEDYVFDDVGSGQKVKLSDLFGKSNRLMIQHVMYDEGESPCKLCSCWVDALEAASVHFGSRCGYVIVCKAPVEKTKAVVQSKNWNVRALSSANNTFNHDFGVEFSKEELDSGNCYNYGRKWYFPQAPGLSFFVKGDDGKVYHRYSTYAAGIAEFHPMFAVLDCLPEGRDEEGQQNMWWIKHKNEY